MIYFYIDTAIYLANTFYGIPFFLVNIVLTLIFIFLFILPLSKINFLQRLNPNNPIVKIIFGIPLTIMSTLTFGMTLISFLNVLNRIFGFGWF